MPPKETTTLLGEGELALPRGSSVDSPVPRWHHRFSRKVIVSIVVLFAFALLHFYRHSQLQPIGPYELVECQEGRNFFDYYNFYDGADSLGSAGYNTYVGKKRADKLGLISTMTEDEQEYIYMKSEATKEGPRESIRLEGRTRFDRGLFILDVDHMPTGCGVWPAFWMTDEDNWPDNGEIDILEGKYPSLKRLSLQTSHIPCPTGTILGVNMQPQAKTALHTSESCSMYAHVPDYERTGIWDTATGIPDTFTGNPDNFTRVVADNCWNMAPHQWGNQGCVAVNTDNATLGDPLNKQGGGTFVLEWDPANGYIKSWVFPRTAVPDNLYASIHTASSGEGRVIPQPEKWGLPYGYFAIGEESGCSADHFKNMRIVFNLAFCGTVAGNRFFRDCPDSSKKFNVEDDPVQSCNAWIASSPKELDEAYWKLKGVYVYERTRIPATKKG